MRKCPKCASQYGDELKLCRTCGAILEAVENDLPPPADPLPPEEELGDDTSPATPPAGSGSWKCPQCGESVPGEFEVCWNCGTGQDGTPDPGFGKDPESVPGEPEPPESEPSEQPPVAKPIDRRCARCGSATMIPNARILNAEGDVHVAVEGDPQAMIFKNRLCERLVADVCGDCGHVDLKVEHPRDLYEHYLQSIEQQRE
jgi:hypothetical protein